MVKSIEFFDKEEDLKNLTGLTHDELWAFGFDLDDWDWGFVSDECYTKTVEVDEDDPYSYPHDEVLWDIPQYVRQILNMMDSYCVGFHHTEFRGGHYYMQYHS